MSTESNQAFGGPEDEDLFDFPVSPAYSAEGAAAGGSAPQDEPIALDDAADAPAPTPQEPVAAAQPEVTTPTPAPTPNTALNEVDFDLDEDLFNFGPLFDATQPLSTPADAAAIAALDAQPEPAPATASAPAASPQATGAATTPRAAEPAPAPSPAPSAAAAAPVPSAQEPAKAPAMASLATDELLAAGMAPPAGVDWSPEPKRGKLIEILAVSFLVLNTAMIVLAWRAGSDFRETLAAVTRTVTDSVAEGHAQGQLRTASPMPQGTQASIPVNPDVIETDVNVEAPHNTGSNASRATTSQAQTQQPEQAPSDLLDMPQASLELAMERIEAGRYSEARRGLFRLLANRDRTALSDAMVAQAEMLIARAFAAQAEEVDR